MSYHLHQSKTPSTLSFFPNTRGVGFCYFEPNKQYHSAFMITTRNRFTNEKYLHRMKEKIDVYQPRILVLEEYRKSKGSVKKKRTSELIKSIADYAKKQNITIMFYKRDHIRDVFSSYNVMKKYDIAQLICTWIPELQYSMYKPRNGGMEPYSAALFEAVSLCLTYFYLND